MIKRCPFCLTEIDIPPNIGEGGYCKCGAYGLISLLSDAHLFTERARKALGIEDSERRKVFEIVDGGIVFEAKDEPVMIQWAKKPQ